MNAKDKYLYLWNDMPLFYSSIYNESINTFLMLIQECAKPVCTECRVIDNNSYQDWYKNIYYQLKHKAILQIGTRPGMLKFSESNTMNLNAVRSNFQNGSTKSVYIEDQKALDMWLCNAGSELHVVEDVLVTGKTVDFILKQIRNLGYGGHIIFHIFCANSYSLMNLQQKSDFGWQATAHIQMKGKPIQQSTLICCHDLLFGYMDDKHYFERKDLLSIYFGNKVNKLINEVVQLQTIMGRGAENG